MSRRDSGCDDLLYSAGGGSSEGAATLSGEIFASERDKGEERDHQAVAVTDRVFHVVPSARCWHVLVHQLLTAQPTHIVCRAGATPSLSIGSRKGGPPSLKGGNEPALRAVGCETIYAFIYRAGQQADQLWRYLTRRYKRRRPRRSIKDRVSIHERPRNVDARTEGGHWEGDLIICKRTRPVLVLHERKSRVTLAARLAGKTAAETISVMLPVFARVEPALRKSITFDNDTAFAQHALLRTMRAMTTWFCDAYASWQKGGIENANGRLRRWLPRQTDIDKVSDEEIQDIVITANLTPRKCLGFKTPFQAILKELGKDNANPVHVKLCCTWLQNSGRTRRTRRFGPYGAMARRRSVKQMQSHALAGREPGASGTYRGMLEQTGQRAPLHGAAEDQAEALRAGDRVCRGATGTTRGCEGTDRVQSATRHVRS